MRVVFLGTPQFAVPTLEALVTAKHEILAVYTQPDRPRGRGRPTFSFSRQGRCVASCYSGVAAGAHQAPGKCRGACSSQARCHGGGRLRPDHPAEHHRHPAFGILNVHASLLPKYRGAAPIQWAIAQWRNEDRCHHYADRCRSRHRRHALKRSTKSLPMNTRPS